MLKENEQIKLRMEAFLEVKQYIRQIMEEDETDHEDIDRRVVVGKGKGRIIHEDDESNKGDGP
jgi:uncharacterized ubiquitin-like protein YukD